MGGGRRWRPGLGQKGPWSGVRWERKGRVLPSQLEVQERNDMNPHGDKSHKAKGLDWGKKRSSLSCRICSDAQIPDLQNVNAAECGRWKAMPGLVPAWGAGSLDPIEACSSTLPSDGRGS